MTPETQAIAIEAITSSKSAVDQIRSNAITNIMDSKTPLTQWQCIILTAGTMSFHVNATEKTLIMVEFENCIFLLFSTQT